MNDKPIQEYTDSEPHAIIRAAENSHLSGSRYQKAKNEWDLRKDLLSNKPQVHINASNVHFGKGNNLSTVNPSAQGDGTPPWLKNSSIVVGIVVTIFPILWGVYVYLNPNSNKTESGVNTEVNGSLVNATSSINISSILKKQRAFETSLERSNFLEKYQNVPVLGSGSFSDILESAGGYNVYLSIEGYLVACSFQSDNLTEQKLFLLKKGDTVTFRGTFRNGNWAGIAFYIQDCKLGN